jgi:hypothetical protein
MVEGRGYTARLLSNSGAGRLDPYKAQRFCSDCRAIQKEWAKPRQIAAAAIENGLRRPKRYCGAGFRQGVLTVAASAA